MIPFFRHIAYLFFEDELAFRRWARGGLLAFAGGGTMLAQELSSLLDAPGLVKAIKLAAVVAGFVAGSLQSSAAKRTAP